MIELIKNEIKQAEELLKFERTKELRCRQLKIKTNPENKKILEEDLECLKKEMEKYGEINEL